MNNYETYCKKEEKTVFALRALYGRYGYTPYKMNKFEDYDLYVRNKEFLVSEDILTFTDISGKLKALKPDVTLSILKNGRDDGESVQKVFYNENVYRAPKGSLGFCEIMQTGLECIGAVDNYCIYEVLSLAAQSLASISDNWVMDVSQLDIVSYALEALGISKETAEQALICIAGKNMHELRAICTAAGVDEARIAWVESLCACSGKPEQIMPMLSALCEGTPCASAAEQLRTMLALLEEEGLGSHIRVDFSVISDRSYYNGMVFRGFIEGVPQEVLSGGQYDRLAAKMGRHANAIGFAVYLNRLEKLYDGEHPYDVDTVLLYADNTSPAKIRQAVKNIYDSGRSVTAQRKIPEKLRYRQVLYFNDKEDTVCEYHT